MVTTVNEMEKKISSLIERFKYVKACFCDSDAFQRRSAGRIPQQFKAEGVSIFPQLDSYTASTYPEHSTRVLRLNFLQQFLYEVEYVHSPESVRSLRSNEVINWKPSIQLNYSYDLVLPHIYKSFGRIKFVFLRVSTTNFDLHAVKVISACCSMFVRIFENLEEELPSLSPTEMILLDNIIKNTITLVLSPLVDILTDECQKVVKRAFLDVMCH